MSVSEGSRFSVVQKIAGMPARPRFRSGSQRDLRSATERLMRRGRDLPAVQTRTCVQCGNRTTFVQDTAGWYSCVECGRYA